MDAFNNKDCLTNFFFFLLHSLGDSTPLMEAASGGYADIVKLLIEHGANVNAKSSVGNTALTYACCGGYEDVVKILLDAGADVEHQNDNGHTPLMEAASCGHVGECVCGDVFVNCFGWICVSSFWVRLLYKFAVPLSKFSQYVFCSLEPEVET